MDIKSALIVDDSKIARITLKKQLESRGISVTLTKSGKQALDFLDSNNPDIIFMECLTSGIDVFETIRQIQSRPNLSVPPIVMCTGKESKEDKQRALQFGAAGYLCKSSSPEPLNTLLDDLSNKMAETHATVVSSEAESKKNVKTAANNTKLYDINNITKIAEQISYKTAVSVAEKTSLDQISAVTMQHSRDLNKKINVLTEQLEGKVIYSIRASLEEVHDYIDKQIEIINQNTLPELKDSIIDSVTTSFDNNQLLLNEVEDLTTQFNQLEINQVIEQQCEQYLLHHLPVQVSTLLKQKSSQRLIHSMIRYQLVEQKAKLEEIEKLEAKAGLSSNVLSWLALFLGAAALSVSGYLFLQLNT